MKFRPNFADAKTKDSGASAGSSWHRKALAAGPAVLLACTQMQTDELGRLSIVVGAGIFRGEAEELLEMIDDDEEILPGSERGVVHGVHEAVAGRVESHAKRVAVCGKHVWRRQRLGQRDLGRAAQPQHRDPPAKEGLRPRRHARLAGLPLKALG